MLFKITLQRSASKRLRYSFRGYATELKKTPFYDLHVKNGATMVDYAGFSMPVLYKGQTHIQSHNWVRENAGLFDVSHMLQHRFSGPDAAKLLEKVTPSDLQALKPYTSTLSVLLNEEGGIIDDTIIVKHDDLDYYVVTNAGCREKDLKFFSDQARKHGFKLKHQIINGGLLALQGPKAASTLQSLTDFDLSTIGFGESKFVSLKRAPSHAVHVSRGGYTGEDGFEISIEDEELARGFSQDLLANENVRLIGLAARDSLRLEAGMCLYGHELTEDIGPIAARLAWVVGKRRRDTKDFNGAKNVLKDLAEKKCNLRTGLLSSGPAPRHGNKVFDADGNEVGEITSGSLSPTLGKNVSMAYLPRSLTKVGTNLSVEIRGKLRPVEVAKMPFVAPKYFRKE